MADDYDKPAGWTKQNCPLAAFGAFQQVAGLERLRWRHFARLLAGWMAGAPTGKVALFVGPPQVESNLIQSNSFRFVSFHFIWVAPIAGLTRNL